MTCALNAQNEQKSEEAVTFKDRLGISYYFKVADVAEVGGTPLEEAFCRDWYHAKQVHLFMQMHPASHPVWEQTDTDYDSAVSIYKSHVFGVLVNVHKVLELDPKDRKALEKGPYPCDGEFRFTDLQSLADHVLPFVEGSMLEVSQVPFDVVSFLHEYFTRKEIEDKGSYYRPYGW